MSNFRFRFVSQAAAEACFRAGGGQEDAKAAAVLAALAALVVGRVTSSSMLDKSSLLRLDQSVTRRNPCPNEVSYGTVEEEVAEVVVVVEEEEEEVVVVVVVVVGMVVTAVAIPNLVHLCLR